MRSNLYFLILIFFLISCSEPKQRVVDGDPEPSMPNFFLRNFKWDGVDSDKDGVIDEVEIWINNNVNDSNLRKAYKQLATDIIQSLWHIDNVKKSQEHSWRIIHSVRCVNYFQNVLFKTSHEKTLFQDKFLHEIRPRLNFIRKQRSVQSSKNFAGTVISSTKREADFWQHCRFEVSNRKYYEKIMREKFPGFF